VDVAGDVHFFGHETVGAAIVDEAARRFRFDRALHQRVRTLVLLHQRPALYEGAWTEGAVRRLIRDAGDALEDLLDLSRADVTSHRPGVRDGGRVRIDTQGRPVVSYRLSGYDAGHLRRGLEEGARLLEAAGAQEIWAPHARMIGYRPDAGEAARARWLDALDRGGFGPNQIQLASFHQMASCRMGGRATDSVVNADNQVWGIPGLYVADASTFPSSSGVNPTLTIMGIAHRAAGVIASKV
jgi:choline dehydrogenase-like flavoprotein